MTVAQVGIGSDPAATAPPLAASADQRHTRMPSVVALGMGIVAYRLIIDFAYRDLIAGPFDYHGFRNQPTLSGIVLSWMFLLALLPLLVRVFRSETISAHVTAVLVLISLVPTTTLIAHQPAYSLWYAVLMFVYWLGFLVAAVFMPAIRPFIRPIRSDLPHVLVTVILSATVIFLSWRHTGFRLHFGLFDVYELRAEAREYQVAAVLGYFATFADNTLPILLAYYLRRRWFVVAAALAGVVLLNFGIAATKQVLFLLVFALASIAVREDKHLSRNALMVLTGITIISMIEWQVFGTVFLTSLSLYRLLFLPAHMHWVHFEFFQTHDLLYLTQSALRFFFESPYKENIQFLLGEYYIGEFSARANNGLFSDGYMNFGSVSVLFYPVLCVALLKLVEGASDGLSANVRFMIIVALSFVVLGLPLPTAILSAGVALLVLLLPTLPRRDPSVA